MHFRHISVKIQPKNLKLVYYQFLSSARQHSIGGHPQGTPWLLPWAESGYPYQYAPLLPNFWSLLLLLSA